MQNRTKLLFAAGAVAMLGLGGLAGLAQADMDGGMGGGHCGMGRGHSGSFAHGQANRHHANASLHDPLAGDRATGNEHIAQPARNERPVRNPV